MARDPVLDPEGLERAVERLSDLIPGYGGYGPLHRPQDEDRALRIALFRQLGLIQGRLARALRSAEERLSTPDLAEAQRNLDTLRSLRDRIHFAPSGPSSLLGRPRLEEDLRAGLLTRDAELWAAVTELDTLAGSLDETARRGTGRFDGATVGTLVARVEETLEVRDEFLRGER